ncbi:hypothetical protein Bca52824_022978 [Brassica carinata]|uniref:Uncharacterized protein n=1 Tax=Brassica carinata TaxID=52824 RepID=A0A8X7VHR8_BRACI|nr:hypothetical protein Bca52824_022978 [Brassica carinata]
MRNVQKSSLSQEEALGQGSSSSCRQGCGSLQKSYYQGVACSKFGVQWCSGSVYVALLGLVCKELCVSVIDRGMSLSVWSVMVDNLKAFWIWGSVWYLTRKHEEDQILHTSSEKSKARYWLFVFAPCALK